MHNDDLCETEVLTRSRFCVIARCTGCRSLHVHMGAISVRLREEVLRDLCETLASVYLTIGNDSGMPHSHSLQNH